MEITIKDYESKYYEEFVKLVAEFQQSMSEKDWTGSNIPFASDEDCRKYADQLIKDTNEMEGKCLLAFNDKDEPIGFTQGITDRHKDDVLYLLAHKPEPNGGLGVIYVKEEYRGMKVGQRLMSSLCDYFTQNGCKSLKLKVLVDNTNAIKLYEQMGFRVRSLEMEMEG